MAGELVFLTGATGFIGFVVLRQALQAGYHLRVSVRRSSQASDLKAHPLISPFASQISFVVIPDITLPGAFDNALEGVSYILHVASPLPNPTENPEKDIIIPAIHGTTSILNSALLFPSIKRVVITSSVVAVLSGDIASNGSDTPISPHTRVSPLPTGPYNTTSAYRASKALALDATDRFVAEQRPAFSVVNFMPGYVIGRNELITEARNLISGSNAVVLSIVLGEKPAEGKRPMMVSDVRDVARVQIASLDEKKVVVGRGASRSFLIDGGSAAKGVELNDAKTIAKRHFPAEAEKGVLKLGGAIDIAKLIFESQETTEVFGELESYEAMIKEVVGQYLELLEKEKA